MPRGQIYVWKVCRPVWTMQPHAFVKWVVQKCLAPPWRFHQSLEVITAKSVLSYMWRFLLHDLQCDGYLIQDTKKTIKTPNIYSRGVKLCFITMETIMWPVICYFFNTLIQANFANKLLLLFWCQIITTKPGYVIKNSSISMSQISVVKKKKHFWIVFS